MPGLQSHVVEKRPLIVDGECVPVGETAQIPCDVKHCFQEYDHGEMPVLTDSIECQQLEKLCELIVEISNDPTAAIEGGVVVTGKCTPDGRTLVHCVKKDEDGNIIGLTAFAINPETGGYEPYSGPCEKCVDPMYFDTGCVVICGPQFGATVITTAEGGCYFFNPETKSIEELDTVVNELGKPASPIDDPNDLPGVTCYYERVQATVCNDNPDAPLVLDSEAILALIAASGETYNNEDANPVDFGLAGQELLGASVQSFHQGSLVKKADGTDFTATSAEACVLSAGGDRFNLQQGGTAPLGDTFTSIPGVPVVIDESLEIACGSAIRICFDMRVCLDEDGMVLVAKPGGAGGFIKEEATAVKARKEA